MMTSERGLWVRLESQLKRVAPLFLVLLGVYLYSSFITPLLSKTTLRYLEFTIVFYFVFELVVKYIVSDGYREFLRDYWYEIILVVPFFKSLKLLGVVGKTLKILKYVPYVQKAVKIPKILWKTTMGATKSDTSPEDK